MLSRVLVVIMPSILVAVGTVSGIAPALAESPIPSPSIQLAQAKRPYRQRGQWLNTLNLSPEQKQQIQEISQQYRPQISERRQALQQAQQELRNLMAGNATDVQVREKYGQVQTLRQEVAYLRFESMLAIRKVLTPQQRQQFAQQMNTRRHWRGQPRTNPAESLNLTP
jgi:Spy/CpxP family protein refolding chaperone